MSTPLLIYLATVAGIGTLLIVRTMVGLSRTLRRRVNLVKERTRFTAIRTDSPVEDADERAKERALAAIAKQTTSVRRLVIPSLVLGVFILLGLPFLTEVPATTVSLVAAAITVLLGVASRNAVENAVSGLLIAGSRTFNIGDTVTVGAHYGTVEDIGITHTTVKEWDWRRYVVPNGKMLTKEVINYNNRESLIWARLEFYVAYESDLDVVREVAVQIAREHRLIVGNEEARMWVMGMEKEAVKCWLAMWVRSPADAWTIRVEVAEKMIGELASRGIRTHSYKLHAEPGVVGR